MFKLRMQYSIMMDDVGFEVGDFVKINSGPLTGTVGLITSHDDTYGAVLNIVKVRSWDAFTFKSCYRYLAFYHHELIMLIKRCHLIQEPLDDIESLGDGTNA